MNIFDQYCNLKPITIRGVYGSIVTVIPAGTRGCIHSIPTVPYHDPWFEVLYEGQFYAQQVKRAIL